MRWWTEYGGEVERVFQGERWTCAEKLKGVINWIEAVDLPGLCLKQGRIHTGLNSGYQAMGLAYQWGAARIILLGFDFQRGPNGESHHHGDHGGKLPNLGTLPEWVRRMAQLGGDLRAQGVEVINSTRRTAINCLERLPIGVALGIQKAGATAALILPQHVMPAEHAALSAGLKAAGYKIGTKPDLTVIWLGDVPYKGGRTIYAENGYWGTQDRPNVALALDCHNGGGRWPAGSQTRLERLGIPILPWRKAGGHILLCPSGKNGHNPPPADWTARTVAELRKHTQREIRIRKHPGNWKRLAEHPDVSLARDLEGAHACVIWHSAAGVRALAWGVPVIYTAPHWICAGAAGNRLEAIEAPLMPDRQPVFERLASAQWTLEEISSGEPFRALMSLPELTVLCVLKASADFNAEYVRKLRDGVAKHLTIPHRFVCISDVSVPCERIPLKYDWPGWWCKIAMFEPGVITGPTLYLDLDTVITGPLDAVASIPFDFAMLDIKSKEQREGNSGAMWFRKPQPHVFERFVEKPQHWIDYHIKNANGRYMGDQAFIGDSFEEIPKLHHALPGFFVSYKYDKCQQAIPAGASVVCFGGHPRPHEAGGWVPRVWK